MSRPSRTTREPVRTVARDEVLDLEPGQMAERREPRGGWKRGAY